MTQSKPQWQLDVYRYLSYWNNLLLIPLFTIMVLETSVSSDAPVVDFDLANIGFCVFFVLEWSVGFYIAGDRKAYMKKPAYLLDLISSIPFGYVFQGLRLVRLFRMLQILRVVLRARRFRGRGAKLVKAGGIVGATVFAGAMGLRVVEPQTVPHFEDALWWSLVTMSTVGYGDIVPQTQTGRLVAGMLILFGIGVFGYVAGFMTSIVDDPEDDEMLASVRRLESNLEAIREQLESVHGVKIPHTEDLTVGKSDTAGAIAGQE